MAATFDRELLAILEKKRMPLRPGGAAPDLWRGPITNRHFPVPNGSKSRHTANEVLKQAGLPEAF